MARGRDIIVSSNPKGFFDEGVINDTSKPGTVMMMDTSKAASLWQGGNPWFIAAAYGTDGLKVVPYCLLADAKQGKTLEDAYVAGAKCQLYCPIAGEEMNILAGEVAGTGNSYTFNDRLILDAESGILVPFTGSPQDTMFQAMETVTQVAGSFLLWVVKT